MEGAACSGPDCAKNRGSFVRRTIGVKAMQFIGVEVLGGGPNRGPVWGWFLPPEAILGRWDRFPAKTKGAPGVF